MAGCSGRWQRDCGRNWPSCSVQINEEKSRTVDLARGESFGFLGFDFRRVRSRREMAAAVHAQAEEAHGVAADASRGLPAIPIPTRGRVVEIINPILRGWVNYFAIGHSSRCFQFVQRWVELKIRRHMMRARKRQGFGWERWSTQWLYNNPGAVQRLPGASGSAESPLGRIGLITHGAKQTGERSAGNPHAPFDVAGAGNVTMVAGLRATAKAMEHPPEPNVGAPVLDPTAKVR